MLPSESFWNRKIIKRWPRLGDRFHLSKTSGLYYVNLAPKAPWEFYCCNKTSEEEEKRQHDGIQNNALKAHREIKTSIVRLLYGASVGYAEKRPDIAEWRVKFWLQETQELNQRIFSIIRTGLSDSVSSGFEYLHLMVYFNWALCKFISGSVKAKKVI